MLYNIIIKEISSLVHQTYIGRYLVMKKIEGTITTWLMSKELTRFVKVLQNTVI